ncbi:hypothetical protein [Fulvivirga ligni]|uniref:hypothetical protein n=1 Tax=Fulvivirga ligni TaxID=2904246 RepID=UPI001F2BD224|nr:hypothetical protein [Fulvivirga ligni]UII21155.1 hypothetical protein LVD16_25295 [Fulvivirga ligni]
MRKYTKASFLILFFSLNLMLGCKPDRLKLVYCDPMDEQCDVEQCEKFQDAIIMIQLFQDGYDISFYKVTKSVKYLENLTEIKGNINSYEIPVYSSKDKMLKDIEAWITWFDENVCKQSEDDTND